MRLIILLAVCIATVVATPKILNPSKRIVGGSLTTINRWPYKANILAVSGNNFRQWCGGTIINNRSVLTAAHCSAAPFQILPASTFRFRLGSSFASSGGVIVNVAHNILHPNYNMWTLDSDVMMMRNFSPFLYSNVIQRATIASPTYFIPDNQAVWITGWGSVTQGGIMSEQLREVQVFTVNQNICAQRYGSNIITPNMFCTGVLDVGGRDACQGDYGGPVIHNGIVVGISSFGRSCGHHFYPGVNARVSPFSSWIVANA